MMGVGGPQGGMMPGGPEGMMGPAPGGPGGPPGGGGGNFPMRMMGPGMGMRMPGNMRMVGPMSMGPMGQPGGGGVGGPMGPMGPMGHPQQQAGMGPGGMGMSEDMTPIMLPPGMKAGPDADKFIKDQKLIREKEQEARWKMLQQQRIAQV